MTVTVWTDNSVDVWETVFDAVELEDGSLHIINFDDTAAHIYMSDEWSKYGIDVR